MTVQQRASTVVRFLALGIFSILLMQGSALGQYYEDFDSLTAGDGIVGVDGWEVIYYSTDTGLDAVISDEQSYSPDNALATDGYAYVVRPFSGAFTSGKWIFSAWTYVTDSTAFNYAYIYLFPSYTTSMSTVASTGILLYASEADIYTWGPATSSTVKDLVFDEWVLLEVEFDLDDNSQKVYYDDVLLGEYDWYGSGGQAALEGIAFYSYSGTGTPEIFLDDVSVIRDCNGNSVDDQTEVDLWIESCDVAMLPDACINPTVTKLTEVEPAVDELTEDFGASIALGDGVLAVGASLDDQQATNAGAVYVYRRKGTEWAFETKLTASDGEAGDDFGCALSASGNWLLVGARHDDDGGSNTGSAYIFEYHPSSSSWTQVVKLTGTGTSPGDEFGAAVSIDGDYAVVGANLDDDEGTSTGAAYVFHWSGTAWSQTTTLEPNGLGAGDQLGRAVSVSGDRIYVSATGDDDVAAGAGAVYVFALSSGQWVEDDKLVASNGETIDALGLSLASQCGLVAAGTPQRDGVTGINSGAVYVYRHTAQAWDEEQIILPPAAYIGKRFGTSVAISGTSLLVGADMGDEDKGGAFLFTYDGDEWVETGVFESPEGSGTDFGVSVGLNIVDFAIGAPNTGATDPPQGAAYAFSSIDCNGNSLADSCEIAIGQADDENGNGVPDECDEAVAATKCTIGGGGGSQPKFKRGDVDGNGTTSALLDSLALLRWQFSAGTKPGCMDAADVDGSNAVSALLDSLALLRWQFSAGTAPASPGPSACGTDPDNDATVGCDTPPTGCN